ncbi:4a-hydroxytetrahydrobiopterin dehydratase [Streptomyces sp. NPDC060194]|uniref:4a-hydroxytetrahydrobiopterin dehydratase n=1 Tax=Streptomyces sp. NPDC060194 TaxID=3347069 RepID=UPI003668BDE5
MPIEPLTPKDVEERLRELPGWSLDDGSLTRSYRLGSHIAAAAFTLHIAQIQDDLDHHSDLTLGYDSVALSVRTHAADGAITDRDFALATRVEAIAPAHDVR